MPNRTHRIAKNSLMLYIRMALTVLVALYTSRIILEALGVEDYGIYNVVGGVVTMLGFITGSLGGASSRYITYAIGKNDTDGLPRLFSCIFSIHLLLAAGIFVIAETVGLWFVLNKLVIPEDRMIAAFWVYQASVLTFIVSILSVPYNAILIAYERMSAFAYISIIEVTAKLLAVYVLLVVSFDRLIVYAILILFVQITIRLIYTVYCHRHFSESRERWIWDKKLSRELFVYAGWTMNGNLAVIGYTQGINILLNIFFGPAVNAARGIAVQVQAAVTQFFNNFQLAVNPQITKSYASGEYTYMHKLIIYSTKYSFFLVWLVALPILLETPYILSLWLKTVPDHTVMFVRLMLIVCMDSTLSYPCITAIHATGNIKKFQLVEGSMLLSIIPVCYIGLKYFCLSPEGVFVVYLVIELMTQIARMLLVFPKVHLSIRTYLRGALFPISLVCIFSSIAPVMLHTSMEGSFLSLFLKTLVTLFSLSLCIYFFGMNTNERSRLRMRLQMIIKNKM